MVGQIQTRLVAMANDFFLESSLLYIILLVALAFRIIVLFNRLGQTHAIHDSSGLILPIGQGSLRFQPHDLFMYDRCAVLSKDYEFLFLSLWILLIKGDSYCSSMQDIITLPSMCRIVLSCAVLLDLFLCSRHFLTQWLQLYQTMTHHMESDIPARIVCAIE